MSTKENTPAEVNKLIETVDFLSSDKDDPVNSALSLLCCALCGQAIANDVDLETLIEGLSDCYRHSVTQVAQGDVRLVPSGTKPLDN